MGWQKYPKEIVRDFTITYSCDGETDLGYKTHCNRFILEKKNLPHQYYYGNAETLVLSPSNIKSGAFIAIRYFKVRDATKYLTDWVDFSVSRAITNRDTLIWSPGALLIPSDMIIV